MKRPAHITTAYGPAELPMGGSSWKVSVVRGVPGDTDEFHVSGIASSSRAARRAIRRAVRRGLRSVT